MAVFVLKVCYNFTMSKNIQWIVGILAALTLMPALLVFSLYRATERELAVDMVSLGMAAALSPKGVDDVTDIKLLLATAKVGADGFIQPIPGLALKISKNDIASLSPKEARAAFFRPLAEAVYDGGDDGLKTLATSASMKEAVSGGAGFLKLVSADTHTMLLKVSFVALIFPLVFLLFLLIFSIGRSRFTSAGWSLIFGSAPGLLIFSLAFIFISRDTAPASFSNCFGPAANYAASIALPPVLKMMVETYGLFFAAGITFLTIALVWRISTSNKQTVVMTTHKDAEDVNLPQNSDNVL